MIRFADVSELLVIKNDSESYKNIVPSKKMTNREANDFWKAEFLKLQRENVLDTFDVSLLDIYDCRDDEIDINFEVDDKLQIILDKFDMNNWDKLNETERMQIVEEFARTLGEKIGLNRYPDIMFFYSKDDGEGYYDVAENVLGVNKAYLDDPKETIDTIAHEYRHMYQLMRAEVLETREDALFKLNLENYISPVNSDNSFFLYLDYYDQYIEADARAFANKLTEAMGQ